MRFSPRLPNGGRQALILTGANSLFWLAWSFSSYQTVYLQEVGFSASQLGLLNALTVSYTHLGQADPHHAPQLFRMDAQPL